MELAPIYAPEKQSDMRQSMFHKKLFQHHENNASILANESNQPQAPWTPKSLGRAKSAIIYRVCTSHSLTFSYAANNAYVFSKL